MSKEYFTQPNPNVSTAKIDNRATIGKPYVPVSRDVVDGPKPSFASGTRIFPDTSLPLRGS